MTGESQSRALLDRLYSAMNRGDLDAMDEIIADDYVDYTDGVRGPAAFKQRIAAFPDLQVTVDEVIRSRQRITCAKDRSRVACAHGRP